MAKSENQFFENQTVSSKIKASIVSEYFPSYCKIIVSKNTVQLINFGGFRQFSFIILSNTQLNLSS